MQRLLWVLELTRVLKSIWCLRDSGSFKFLIPTLTTGDLYSYRQGLRAELENHAGFFYCCCCCCAPLPQRGNDTSLQPTFRSSELFISPILTARGLEKVWEQREHLVSINVFVKLDHGKFEETALRGSTRFPIFPFPKINSWSLHAKISVR